jgi:hypothetical protein
MRNDTMKFWNFAARFLLDGVASKSQLPFSPGGARASRYDSAAVRSLIMLTGASKGND